MDTDDYRPRPNDHLVEPFFGGLGAGAAEQAHAPEAESRGRGVLARLWRLLTSPWRKRTARAPRCR